MLRMAIAMATAGLACGCASPLKPIMDGDLMTVAERSEYRRTATHDEVERLSREIAGRSPRARLRSLGTSQEGRDIPLLIIADPPIGTAEDARNDRRLTVLLFGNIHAGEVCGKEALLALSRELALGRRDPILDDLIICVVPNYNPDGNERFAADNRPGQIGPEEMGQRANAQGFDLNRDYIKAEAPETRAMLRFMNEWDPAVIVDTHTTNGSFHQYTLTYQGPKHPAGDTALLEHVRDVMLPAIDDRFEEASGYHSFFYGFFWEDHTLWVTYPAGPRYGAPYRGLRNRIGILSEAYAYASFRDRVLATEAFCRSVLQHAADNRNGIRSLLDRADRRTVEAGASGAPIALRTEAIPFPERVTMLGYEQEQDAEGNRIAGAPRTYEVDFVNLFEPTLSVSRPHAYAIPAELAHIADHLRLHGIEVETLDTPTHARVQRYTITGFERAEREFQGHRMIHSVEVEPDSTQATLPAGTLIVRTDQPLGSLAAYMLEPQSTDGLLAWNFFDTWLEVGAAHPIGRVIELRE